MSEWFENKMTHLGVDGLGENVGIRTQGIINDRSSARNGLSDVVCESRYEALDAVSRRIRPEEEERGQEQVLLLAPFGNRPCYARFPGAGCSQNRGIRLYIAH